MTDPTSVPTLPPPLVFYQQQSFLVSISDMAAQTDECVSRLSAQGWTMIAQLNSGNGYVELVCIRETSIT